MEVPPFFGCPECKSTELVWSEDLTPGPGAYAVTQGLRCGECREEYPYVNGVWCLWTKAIKALQFGEVDGEQDLSQQILQANIEIYDEVSEDYGEHHSGTRPYVETLLFLKAIATDYQEPAPPGSLRVVVDVGCSTGGGLSVGSKPYDYAVGVDISLANLTALAARGFTAVLGDCEHLPFQADSIDLITCFAALHHLPDPPSFIASAHGALRDGGVFLIGVEPSAAAMHRSPLAKLVWDFRKPLYRQLARFSERFYLHRDKGQQELNDMAEFGRTQGGFTPQQLLSWLETAGFGRSKVFHGTDPNGFKRYELPRWPALVLNTLSLQNPLLRENWESLTALGLKSDVNEPSSGAESQA